MFDYFKSARKQLQNATINFVMYVCTGFIPFIDKSQICLKRNLYNHLVTLMIFEFLRDTFDK